MAGFLGTGKTTFARELERSTGGVRISIDEWTIGLSGDDFTLDSELFSRTWNLLTGLWPRIARAGADVISDFGFWRRELRDGQHVGSTRGWRWGHPWWVHVRCSLLRKRV